MANMAVEEFCPFYDCLKKPVVVIFHSLPHPSDRKYSDKKKKISITNKIVALAQKAVVVCPSARNRFIDIYKANSKKIVLIPHGSPKIPKIKPGPIKNKLGFSNNILLLNFGFIGKRKNIETIIKAMPTISKEFPSTKLLFLGGAGAYPSAQKNLKIYLRKVKQLVKKLKVEKNVLFITGFIPIKKVIKFYQGADVFIYANKFSSQPASGPLTYAVTAGKAIVSTSFAYANDILSKNNGLLVPIGDSKALAAAVCKILSRPKLKAKLEKASYNTGKNFLWEKVANDYIKLFKIAIKKSKK
jgi:glycosyltransferase involved in cell wall biosynthesis